MTEFWRHSATQLAELIRSRQISAREAAMDSLQRLEKINPKINAIVEYQPEDVLKQADRIDGLISRGSDPGPLAGVPVTTKINVDQTGFSTSNGTVLQKHVVAKANNPVVNNLVRAGAVLLGRSNASAFSLRWFTTNELFGRTINPRDFRLTAGGSSGGAAAAVAAGVGHAAHGTDIAGSIRYPAYACGVHGLRPSHGRVPAYNASLPERGIGPQLMAVSGPIARTIPDLRLMLHSMASADGRDPWWTPAPLKPDLSTRRATLCLRPGGLRIEAQVEQALEATAKRLIAAGWHVETIDDVPHMREAADLQQNLWLGEDFAVLADAVQRDGDRGANEMVEAFRPSAEALPHDIIGKSLKRRATIVRDWNAFLEKHHVLILPVSAELPFRENFDTESRANFWRVWEAQLTQRALAILGLPALTVASHPVNGMPFGVQLVAGRFQEEACLEAGEVIEVGARHTLVDSIEIEGD